MPAQAAIYLPQANVAISKIFPQATSDKGWFRSPTFFDLNLDGDEIRLTVMPVEQLPLHLTGFQNYVLQLHEDQAAQTTAARMINGVRCVLGLQTSNEFSDNDAIWRALFQIAKVFSGFVFVYDSILMPDQTVLVGPLGKSHPPVVVPSVIASSESSGDTTDQDEEDGDPIPPSPERVGKRALAMSAVVCRSFLESDAGNAKAEEFCAGLARWLQDIGVSDELEASEASILQKPLGKLEQREQVDASWSSEALAVLAWAMGRYELPPHDISVEAKIVADSLLFLSAEAIELLDKPKLRPIEEIKLFQDTMFALNWRLTQYRLTHQPMDFEEFARTAWFGPLRLDGLTLAERDLTICGVPIQAASAEDFAVCCSIARERHKAANWLMGYNPVYSEVETNT